MKVPKNWWLQSSWAGQKGSDKNRGTLTCYNPDEKNDTYFMLEIEREPGAEYPIQYNGVLKYTNNKYSNFGKYCLTFVPVLDPVQDTRAIICSSKDKTSSGAGRTVRILCKCKVTRV
jgi:hypothetical protein